MNESNRKRTEGTNMLLDGLYRINNIVNIAWDGKTRVVVARHDGECREIDCATPGDARAVAALMGELMNRAEIAKRRRGC